MPADAVRERSAPTCWGARLQRRIHRSLPDQGDLSTRPHAWDADRAGCLGSLASDHLLLGLRAQASVDHAWRQPGPLGARPEHRNSRRRHQDVLVPADPHPAYQPIPTRRTSRSPTTHSCSFATAGKSPAAQLARARCLTSVSPSVPVLSCPIPLVSLPAVTVETANCPVMRQTPHDTGLPRTRLQP
jgi:hypothetical protein